jgi:hypothetical protein
VIAAALVVLVVVPVVALAGKQGVEMSLLGPIRQGQADLERGARQLETAYAHRDAGMVTAAEASFNSSRRDFGSLSTLAAAAASVPGAPLKPEAGSLGAIVELGDHLGLAGIAASGALRASGVVSGPEAGDTDQMMTWLGEVRDQLTMAAGAIGRVSPRVIPNAQRATFEKARAALTTAVGVINQNWSSLPALLDLLGFYGSRTYLVEQVNPAELRSGGGFIGGVSLVRADHGHVELVQSLPVEAFDYCDALACIHHRPLPGQDGWVAPPAEITGYPLPPQSQVKAWSLEDTGFYPDFPTNAEAAERFGEKLLKVKLDGVVAIDYYAVAPLLDVTGPIDLPDDHLRLDSSNLVDTLVQLDLDRTLNHKSVISAAAGQILSRMATVRSSDLPRVVEMVRQAAIQKHLQLYFNAPSAQAFAADLGWANEFAPPTPDFILETEDNYGGSKSNHFLQRDYRLELSRTGQLLHHRLVVDLDDRAPADRPYDGPHYFAYVRLYPPASATDLRIASAPSPDYAAIERPGWRTQVPPAGAEVTGGWIFVLVGDGLSGRYEVTFDYDTPWMTGADGTHAITWQKQPGTLRDAVSVAWRSELGDHLATADLGSPLRLTLSPDRLTVAAA